MLRLERERERLSPWRRPGFSVRMTFPMITGEITHESALQSRAGHENARDCHRAYDLCSLQLPLDTSRV